MATIFARTCKFVIDGDLYCVPVRPMIMSHLQRILSYGSVVCGQHKYLIKVTPILQMHNKCTIYILCSHNLLSVCLSVKYRWRSNDKPTINDHCFGDWLIGYFIGRSMGIPSAHPPLPTSPSSFIFAYIFTKKHPCLGRWLPTGLVPQLEILDPPLEISNWWIVWAVLQPRFLV